MRNLKDINTELLIASIESQNMVEPCDEKNAHALDWCEVVSVDLFDEIYTWDPEEAY